MVDGRARSIVLFMGVLLLGVAARATIAVDPFPYWDVDPFASQVVIVGLRPYAGMLLDALIGLAAIGVLVCSGGVRPWMIGAACIGSLAAAQHAMGSPADAVWSMNWIAAVLAGLAVWRLPDDRARRLAGACCVALVAPLLLKGGVQVLIEHPATVASFEADKAATFAARGWTADSPMAMQFERRLQQPEATGWFGLANVYATFAAAAAAALITATVGVVRARGPVWAGWTAGLGALASLGALAASGSKGGIAAAALAGVLLGAAALLRKRHRLAGVVGLAAVGVPLVAVAVRGMIGPGWTGELSVLFRAFYAEGAARIFADHPLVGIGPDGFQDAYSVAKPRLSPESVTSPHSVMIDWLAMLGVAGLGWAALLIGAAFAIGGQAARVARRMIDGAAGDQDREPAFHASDLKAVALLFTLVTMAGLMIERPALTPENALARLLGAGLAVVIAAAMARASAPVRRLALAAFGLVILGHIQIEMTGTRLESAAWCAIALGLAANRTADASSGTDEEHKARARMTGRRLGPTLTGVVLLLPLLGCLGSLPALWRWDRGLNAAAAIAEPVGRVASAARLAQASGDRGAMEAAAAMLAKIDDGPMIGSSRVFDERLRAVRIARLGPAAEGLRAALDARPGHHGTRQALSRLLMLDASVASPPARVSAACEEAMAVARGGAESRPRSAKAWGWVATSAVAAGQICEAEGLAGEAAAYRDEAVHGLERAAGFDPFSPTAPARLMRLLSEMGRGADAARWAKEAVRRHALTGLDPLAGMGEADLRLARRLATD